MSTPAIFMLANAIEKIVDNKSPYWSEALARLRSIPEERLTKSFGVRRYEQIYQVKDGLAMAFDWRHVPPSAVYWDKLMNNMEAIARGLGAAEVNKRLMAGPAPAPKPDLPKAGHPAEEPVVVLQRGRIVVLSGKAEMTALEAERVARRLTRAATAARQATPRPVKKLGEY